MASTVLAIIGGTGLYDFADLKDRREVALDTPFGQPSAAIVSGRIGESTVLFLARHGAGHQLLPSEINVRANLYALKSLGAQWCLSISAVGSLQEQFAPGDIIIPDQIIDRTRGRKSTFFGNGICAHVAFAEPFCPVLREGLLDVLADSKRSVHKSGTYLCMEGPAFSTRAESMLYRSWGADIIGMTALPEAKLAREAEMSYATLAIVTDYDCWRHDGADVDIPAILAILGTLGPLAQDVSASLITKLETSTAPDFVRNALAPAIVTKREHIPADVASALYPIIGRYVSS